jgi:hypothetical protein
MHQPLLTHAGIPMLVVELPLMLCALGPVILLETEVVRRGLSLPYRKAIVGVAKANVLSTLIGVPLAWLIMFVIELSAGFPLLSAAMKLDWPVENFVLKYLFHALTAAWIVGSVSGIAFATAVLLVPTFFISAFLEGRSCRRSWADLDRVSVNRSAWYANLASYSLLFLAASAWFGWAIRTHPMS